MKAALKSPSVMKVVLTSSEAAIAYGFPPSKQAFTEDDWTVLDGPAGKSDYFRSKTLAEKLAWDMVANPSINPRGVPLSTINPGFVVGPSLVPWGRFSLNMLQDMATGKMAALPDMVTHVVDVRDCAAMHIVVMNDPATDGHRHLSFGMVSKMPDITGIIRRNFSHRGFSPRPKVAPTWILGIVRLFSAQIGSIYSKLSQPNVYETKWLGVYNYRHKSLEETINASMVSMLAHGVNGGYTRAFVIFSLAIATGAGIFLYYGAPGTKGIACGLIFVGILGFAIEGFSMHKNRQYLQTIQLRAWGQRHTNG